MGKRQGTGSDEGGVNPMVGPATDLTEVQRQILLAEMEGLEGAGTDLNAEGEMGEGLPEDVDRPEAAEVEFLAALGEPTIGLSFLENVLLCIIDAHKAEGSQHIATRDKRLRDAMHAITQNYYRHGQKNADDRKVLLWMALQWTHGSQRNALELPSMPLGPSLFQYDTVNFRDLTDLARMAVKKFDLPKTSTEDAHIRRLKGKFIKQKAGLIMTVQAASSNPHFIEQQILLQLRDIFRTVGVPFAPPSEPSAF